MKVSVIIPTYNRAHLLEEAVGSIFNQSFTDFEILIIDDGSKDQTPEIARMFGEKVKYFRQDHGGLNVARNRALAMARGQYIALLDDDDLWLKDKLELQMSIMDRFSELAYAFTDFFILKENGRKIPEGLSTWFSVPPKWNNIFSQEFRYSELNLPQLIEMDDFNFYTGDIYGSLLKDPYVLPSSAIIRKSCIKSDIKFVEDNWHCGDWEFFARLSHKYPCGFIQKETTLNRSHDDSVRLTRKSPVIRIKDRLELIERVWQADSEFYELHHADVDRAEQQQIVSLVKYLLLESDIQEARKYLRKLNFQSWRHYSLKILLLALLAYFPGGHKLLAITNYIDS